MTRRLSLRATAAHRGQRLDAALQAWLPAALGRPLSKTVVRRLVMAGAVRVDGEPLRRPGQPLAPGALVEALVREELLGREATVRDRVFTLSPREILYEDDALIAVDKPPGLPTQPTVDPGRAHLYGLVRAFLAERGGRDYLGLHQRLDRDTSGVVLFTKDPAANAGLAAQFAGHEVAKIYHALTRRPSRLPPAAWTASGRLAPAGKGRVGSASSGGVVAQTEFRRLETLPTGLLIEARPRTGRKHQIRVQLAEAGLPILGDDVYGGRRLAAPAVPRLMLHAVRLALRHPLSDVPVVVESPYPEDFRGVLDALRAGVSVRAERRRR